MNENSKDLQKLIPVIIISAMFILALGAAVWSAGQGNRNRSGKGNEILSESSPSEEDMKYDEIFQGVLKEVNSSKENITVMDIETGIDIILTYTGASNVNDKYGKEITMGQLSIGEIVDVCYVGESNKLIKIRISESAWEYKGVGNLDILRSDRIMKISDARYKYDDKLVVVSDSEIIGLIDINDKDELTVKGVDRKICSILVTKGHGYIRFENYEQFIGGNIEVGYSIMTQVTENMLLVAREGNYKLVMEKEGLYGKKNITVRRDEEITIDMGEFMPEAKQTSLVEFKISPIGSELYIDGEFTKYNKEIELEYGEYLVKVMLEGYDTFAGLLDVDQPAMTIEINLAEPVEEETPDIRVEDTDLEEEETKEPEEEETVTPSSTPEAGIAKVDYSHNIYIHEPEGVEVYLNGKFKGIAPLSFAKEIGNHTITLRKLGYETKSYSVEVEDDSKDNYFVFEDLKVSSLADNILHYKQIF